ncbi:MAG: GntP family permease [Alphaproteobacteria bacterium]|nr:GntP family permease [Alphaproteobacteria bacterium]
MLGILGILISLALLMYLAYRGVSVLILAPVLALVAAAAAGAPLLGSYSQIFMKALGGFVILYFPLFLLGAIFGKLVETSGSAHAIATATVRWLGRDRAMLAVVLACAILTYGGVSLFVVAFAIYPIAAALFREARIPPRFIPATIALGAFTFTMTALPGTPAIQNAIPMPFFDTTPFAAPGLGAIGGSVMLAAGAFWLTRRIAHARTRARADAPSVARGASGSTDPDALPPDPMPPDKTLRGYAHGEGFDIMEIAAPGQRPHIPSFGVAMAPIVLVVALNYVFTDWIIPQLDTDYLATPAYGSTTVASVRGIWAIISALFLSSLVLIAINWRHLRDLRRSLDDGASASVLPIFNTASLVGFGAVIAALPAFEAIRDAVLGIAPDNPLVSLSIAVNILAGITGSASGGMSIALQMLGPTYLDMGLAAGIDPALLHRVTAIATGGLDALPHNGAVITLLTICKMSHRESYLDIFAVAVAVPILALIVVVALGTMFGAF